jgi:hypothetical protein
LKETHRYQRRLIKKESQSKYLSYLEAAIAKETQETNLILSDLLEFNHISKEKFEGALDLYGKDGEILEILDCIDFEASRGLLPNEDLIQEVLLFEIEEWKKGKGVIKKYLIEDEVWDKWGVEIGDVHQIAKVSKSSKYLYLDLKSLR